MTHPPRVELYLRQSVPVLAHERQRAVLERLRELEGAGLVADLAVEPWPHRVVGDDERANPSLATVGQFDRWARAHDASVRPAFGAHAGYSGYTNQQYATTILPVMCLAVYDDDGLAAVYPRSGPEGVLTVQDGLDRLAAAGSGRDQPHSVA
ncbi:MAG: HTH domain-containing protein [Haloarculaceae archaeon]